MIEREKEKRVGVEEGTRFLLLNYLQQRRLYDIRGRGVRACECSRKGAEKLNPSANLLPMSEKRFDEQDVYDRQDMFPYVCPTPLCPRGFSRPWGPRPLYLLRPPPMLMAIKPVIYILAGIVARKATGLISEKKKGGGQNRESRDKERKEKKTYEN